MKRALSLFLSLLMLLSVAAIPVGAASLPFTDVYSDNPHYDDICLMYEMGLMTGTSSTKFSPNATYTRAMFVTMLGRLDGLNGGMDPDDYTGTAFSDVPAGRWDAPYIKWAAENGIVNGVGNGRFNPQGSITVEQYAAIMQRYLKGANWNITVQVKYGNWPPAISDLSKASSYARTPLTEMLYWGFIPSYYYSESDKTSVDVHPKDKCTRAWIASGFSGVVYAMMDPDGFEWYHNQPAYFQGITRAD